MCKPSCCPGGSSGGGIPAPIVALGAILLAGIAVKIVTEVIQVVTAWLPYILATVGTVAVAGTAGTVWLVRRGAPPIPEFTSRTNRQRTAVQVKQPELTWTAEVLAIGGKPVTVPAYQEVRQPTHAR